MTRTAALAGPIDLDGFTLKITSDVTHAPGAVRSSDGSWRIPTKTEYFDFEITPNDSSRYRDGYVNSARTVAEIYAATARHLRGIDHLASPKDRAKVAVGDNVWVRPDRGYGAYQGQVIARHPVAGYVWVASHDTGAVYAARLHRVEVYETYAKPTRRARAQQEALAL